jgi:hypothetical protein
MIGFVIIPIVVVWAWGVEPRNRGLEEVAVLRREAHLHRHWMCTASEVVGEGASALPRNGVALQSRRRENLLVCFDCSVGCKP